MNTAVENLNENLLTYLKVQLDETSIEYINPPIQLQGGFETQIYKFQLSGASGEFSKPLILRLYPAWFGSGNAIWESTIQEALSAADYPVAKPHLLCEDLSILGGAFFVMDYLPGEQMVKAPFEQVPALLGKNHAALHRIDPDPLVKTIQHKGIDSHLLYLDHRYANHNYLVKKFSWLRDPIEWLDQNRPTEPEELAVCHGDFHPLNILVQDGQVTGVLDWPGFLIADPALDIANTITLSTIPFKHLAPTLGMEVSSLDFDLFVEGYLNAYRSEKPFDSSHLEYYQVRRCVNALAEGAHGQTVWRHPLILKDLNDYIQSVTGIQVDIPD
jgi:aminoglycoside phosphotransferase (APT) family kinase protein